jgi:uncharacterized RDD family membrane protein YckC
MAVASERSVAGAEVLRVRVAGFWRRVLAGAVDLLLLVPVFALLALLLAALFGGRVPRLRELGVDWAVELLLGRNPLALAGFALCAAAGMLYFALLHTLRGQTPGKQLLGLRVINKAGTSPAFWPSLGRTALGVASAILCGIGLIWIAFDREKRGFHDLIAGTWVVQRGSPGEDATSRSQPA